MRQYRSRDTDTSNGYLFICVVGSVYVYVVLFVSEKGFSRISTKYARTLLLKSFDGLNGLISITGLAEV